MSEVKKKSPICYKENQALIVFFHLHKHFLWATCCITASREYWFLDKHEMNVQFLWQLLTQGKSPQIFCFLNIAKE